MQQHVEGQSLDIAPVAACWHAIHVMMYLPATPALLVLVLKRLQPDHRQQDSRMLQCKQSYPPPCSGGAVPGMPRAAAHEAGLPTYEGGEAAHGCHSAHDEHDHVGHRSKRGGQR